MKPFSLTLSALLIALAGTPALAQTTSTTVTTTTTSAMLGSSARQAYDIAKDGVDASLRSRLVSIYGTGSPTEITRWWVIFYDPSVESHGRVVRVENGKITRAYEAKGGVVYSQNLTFDPSQIHGIDVALTETRNYAARQNIGYDHVRAVLRLTADGAAFRWRIEMLDGGTNRGFVFVNTNDGTFALYAPASTPETSGNGSVEADAKQAGNDIKNTFLGIGGDLQQFFTGERTVDQ
jgi:hypothetical protein